MATEEVRSGATEATAAEVPPTGFPTATAAPASVSHSESAAAGDAQSLPEAVGLPDFAAMREGPGRATASSLDRFFDVHVPVWAELGRVELPLGELVKLSEGAVLRLERPISEPVDLVSQGVKLARGEVIVVDDCFAIRIKEIVASK